MTRKRKNYVAQWRAWKKMSAQEFAERLAEYSEMHGIPLPTTTASISRIEGGKQNYTIDFLEAAAAVLATGEDDPTPGDLLSTNPFKGALEVTGMLERLEPRQRKLALGILEAMLAEQDQGYRSEPDED